MDKILVEFPKKRNISFDFGKGDKEKKIIVRPHITMAERIELIQTYLSAYFEHSSEQFDELSTSAIFAEGVFEIALVDMLTNVKVLDDDEGETVTLDDLHSSGLLSLIKSRITDLNALVDMREKILRDAIQERFSFKGIIDMVTEAIGNLDMEKLAELQKGYEELKDNIQDSPLSKVFNEGKK